MKKAQKEARLSKPSKVPCFSWSLLAGEHCVANCAWCYAKKGRYNFNGVKMYRQHNDVDWRRSDWADRMVRALDGEKYFRWFDSGDVYKVNLAKKIYKIMNGTPNTHHWLPTKGHLDPEIHVWLRKMEELPNVCVRYSSFQLDTIMIAEHSSFVTTGWDSTVDTDDIKKCLSFSNGGKCGDCRYCWNNNIKTVAYKLH